MLLSFVDDEAYFMHNNYFVNKINVDYGYYDHTAGNRRVDRRRSKRK